ncbi:hypothetical protein LZ30DRAFT_412081 [Colletotrichum cereale]|nr:hypothetical protein LZ30DRAFT_412081 [Colletotrichum cereale]
MALDWGGDRTEQGVQKGPLCVESGDGEDVHRAWIYLSCPLTRRNKSQKSIQKIVNELSVIKTCPCPKSKQSRPAQDRQYLQERPVQLACHLDVGRKGGWYKSWTDEWTNKVTVSSCCGRKRVVEAKDHTFGKHIHHLCVTGCERAVDRQAG